MEKKLKKILPDPILKAARNWRTKKRNARIASLPELDLKQIEDILTIKLGIKSGDVVLIHSALGNLNTKVSPFKVLELILQIIGKEGTILFPTYPKLTSQKFLESEKIFNIKKTPSYMGILSEIARRHPNAIRSLHPTKSVVAIGNNAQELTSTHHLDIYPYSKESPYYKINNYNGKIIGFGVSTKNLSCVHCADDFLKEKFPYSPYANKVYEAKCIDKNNSEVIVKTYAHDLNKMDYKIEKFIKRNIENDVCEDIDMSGMKFFIADSKKLFEKLVSLALEGKTIYN